MSSNLIQKKTHPQIRHLREIRDGKIRNFLFCEGEKASVELLASDWTPSAVYGRSNTLPKIKSLLAKYQKSATPIHILSNDVMDYVSDVIGAPGIIFIAKRRMLHPPELDPRRAPLLLMLHQQQLPQNVGGMIRTAEAAGVDQIWMTKNTADPFHPKVIRGSSGSVFRMPIRDEKDFSLCVKELGEKNIQTVAADQNGDEEYDAFDWTKPTALVVGAEGSGLTDTEMATVDRTIRIPMKGQIESLNVGVAAAVCLFEAARQRRHAEKFS